MRDIVLRWKICAFAVRFYISVVWTRVKALHGRGKDWTCTNITLYVVRMHVNRLSRANSATTQLRQYEAYERIALQVQAGYIGVVRRICLMASGYVQ
jgi:hypothetical protein